MGNKNEIIENILSHDKSFFYNKSVEEIYPFRQERDSKIKWVYTQLRPYRDRSYIQMDELDSVFAAVIDDTIYLTQNFNVIFPFEGNEPNVKMLSSVLNQMIRDNTNSYGEEYSKYVDISQYNLNNADHFDLKERVRKDVILSQKGTNRPKYENYMRYNLLTPDDAVRLIAYPEQTKEMFFKKFKENIVQFRRVKKLIEEYESLFVSMVIPHDACEIAKVLENKSCSTVTVTFEKNGKSASEKMDKSQILYFVYSDVPIGDTAFPTISKGRELYHKLNLNCGNNVLRISDIVKIEYRNKVIWER